MASKFFIDVTDQYGPTTDVTAGLDATAAGAERFAYLCVFNGGEWKAIAWAEIRKGFATFVRAGRKIAYLPAIHDGEKLVPVAPPLLLENDGSIRTLPGRAAPVSLLATSTSPKKVSPDTGEITPVSHLEPGARYILKRWENGWVDVAEVVADDEPLRFEGLAADGLYWLVREGSRQLERIFIIENGRQRWW